MSLIPGKVTERVIHQIAHIRIGLSACHHCRQEVPAIALHIDDLANARAARPTRLHAIRTRIPGHEVVDGREGMFSVMICGRHSIRRCTDDLAENGALHRDTGQYDQVAPEE